MGAEVLDDRDALFQQRLDVDQVPRPALILEDAPACREAIRPARLGASGSVQVGRAGRADHPLPIDALRRAGLVQGDQHLAQLDPPIGLDHDGLAAPSGPGQSIAARNRPTYPITP